MLESWKRAARCCRKLTAAAHCSRHSEVVKCGKRCSRRGTGRESGSLHRSQVRVGWQERKVGCIQDALHSEFNSGVEIKQGEEKRTHTAVTPSESCQNSKRHKYAPFIPAALRYFHTLLFLTKVCFWKGLLCFCWSTLIPNKEGSYSFLRLLLTWPSKMQNLSHLWACVRVLAIKFLFPSSLLVSFLSLRTKLDSPRTEAHGILTRWKLVPVLDHKLNLLRFVAKKHWQRHNLELF